MLTIKDLTVLDENKRLLNNIHLSLGPNESLGIIGPSGAGKSVMFKRILGLANHLTLRGEIEFQGNIVSSSLQPYLIHEIGYITQDVQNALNPYFRVIDQMVSDLQFVHRMNKKTARMRASASLERIGISKKDYFKYPAEFSSGMQQRVVISMILNRQPRLLIADEITASLDEAASQRSLELIKAYQEEHQMALIYITHNPYQAIDLCDRICVFDNGEMVENQLSSTIHQSHHPTVQLLFKAARLLYGPISAD